MKHFQTIQITNVSRETFIRKENYMDYLNELINQRSRRRKKDSSYSQAIILKNRGYNELFNKMCRAYLSLIKVDYNKKPRSIDTDKFCQSLMYDGMVGVSKIEGQPRCYAVYGAQNESFYAYPNKVYLADYMGRRRGVGITVLDTDDDNVAGIANCAIVYATQDHETPVNTILYYADVLSNIRTSINTCLANITGTRIFLCTKEQQKMWDTEFTRAMNGQPVIISSSVDDLQSFESKLLTAPGTAEELKTLMEAYDKHYADFLNWAGYKINNEIDKKSGVTPLEIVGNNEIINSTLSYRIESIEKGIEQCERIGISGLSVNVDRLKSKTPQYDDKGNVISTGGKED